jgi:hypothetical protein
MRSGSDPSSPSGVRKPNSNRLDEVRYLARGTLNLIEANSAQPSANRLHTSENTAHKSSLPSMPTNLQPSLRTSCFSKCQTALQRFNLRHINGVFIVVLNRHTLNRFCINDPVGSNRARRLFSADQYSQRRAVARKKLIAIILRGGKPLLPYNNQTGASMICPKCTGQMAETTFGRNIFAH